MRARAALALLAVVASACATAGGPLTASSTRTSSPASTEPASFTPTSTTNTFDVLAPANPVSQASAARLGGITCVGSIGASDPVGIVLIHNGPTVLRDYVDPLHPRTVCTFPPDFGGQAQLIDAHHLVAPTQASLYAVIEVPSLQYHWFQLPSSPDAFPYLIGVSPGLDAVAYLVNNISGNTDDVHLATKNGDRIVASLPNPHGGRCGGPEDSNLGAYTHSGNHLYVLDQPFPTLNSLLVLHHDQTQLQLTPPGQLPTGGWVRGTEPAMPVWSPTSETLYYRQGSDVWKLVPGGTPERFLAGVSWWYPTISADGTHLAYSAIRADGLHNVYLVDLVHGGSPQIIGKGARNLPVFLNSTQIWYRSESQGICGPGGDLPLVYDLADGSEAGSIVDYVSSVWPATSSNF